MQHSAHVLLSLLLYKMVQSLACVLMAVFCVILGHQVLTFFLYSHLGGILLVRVAEGFFSGPDFLPVTIIKVLKH